MVVVLMPAYSVDPYCILGVKRTTRPEQVKETYLRLVEALDETNFVHSPQAWVQASQALQEIEHAYERILNKDGEDEQYYSPPPFWPKLGQILVAAGKLTLADLNEIMGEQERTGKRFGRILIERSLLSEQELEIFLVSQGTIEMPDDDTYRFARRLIGLGVIPEDMAYAAIIEHARHGKSLGDILVERGWLSDDILCVFVSA
ncbi:MAG: hypothetical protein K2W82_07305 [Candidatus Obscuribacterales bacterium]|nr:hypothetical protein [Candidatus Obscuribacterales bacterium]